MFMSDDLEIMKPGKTLCVGWAKGIKEAAVSAMTKSDTAYDKVSEAAKLIRKEIKAFANKSEFSFSFDKDCEVNSVPKLFLSFMSILMEGDY